jgi:alanyl-tRNA synthetase
MAERTERLYFEDPYRIEFEARVLKKTFYNGKPALVLDRTCFYPEGGGQPADRGTLNGVQVQSVLEENGEILHVVEKEITSDKVVGRIDWDRRFDHMQQHAGQHVLSQCLVQLFGAETRSFHMGERTSTLEIDKRDISEEEVEQVEQLANAVVFENKEIKSQFIREEEIPKVPLRRPPKKKGMIRVVEVSDFDHSACGGTHPHRTGEIGTIKIIRWEKIRNNIRLEFLCGGRALRDYTQKHKDMRHLSNQLTVDESEVLASFEKTVSELKAQKSQARKMQEKLIQYEAEKLLKENRDKIIRKIYTERTQEEIRRLALAVIKKGESIVLFGLKGEEHVHVFFACSENLDLDMRELVPAVSPLIKGKGGGRPSLVEIAGQKKEGLKSALERAHKLVSQKL